MSEFGDTPKRLEKYAEVKSRRGLRDCCICFVQFFYSLKLILVISLVLMVVLMSVVWASILNSVQYNGTMSITSSLRSHALNELLVYLREFFSLGPKIITTSRNTLLRQAIDPNNIEGLSSLYWSFMTYHPDISSAYYGTVNANGLGFVKTQGMYLFGLIWPGITPLNAIRLYPVLDVSTGSYDPSIYIEDPNYPYYEAEWYEYCSKQNGTIWRPIHTSFPLYPGELFLTLCEPLFNLSNSDQLLGVTVMDFTLINLQNYLINTVNIGSGYGYIMEDAGYVVATSDINAPSGNPLPNGDITRILASEANNTLISTSAAVIIQTHGSNLTSIDTNQYQLEYSVGTESILVQYSRLTDDYGLSLIVVLVVKESDFLEPLYTMRMWLWIIAGITVVIAFVTSILFTFCITYPLHILQAAMRKIAGMNWNEAKSSALFGKVAFSEVHQLQHEFNKMKTAIVSFGRYVPKEVVKTLLMEGREAELGLDQYEISIFFSDIVGFTTISERLSPQKLLDVVTEYFSLTSEIILSCEGTIDKFIGDAIMAFFNAPGSVENHQYLAVKSALLIQRAIRSINIEDNGETLSLGTRIGINTGKALVGNMGSANRINYTAIGDSVNLAARLESINKEYGTFLLISEAVYQHVKGNFLCRPVDKVIVVGKSKSTVLYNVLDFAECRDNELITVTKRFEQAFHHYLNRNFTVAIQEFEAFKAYDPNDKASAVMIQRCQQFIENDPGPSWSGTYTMLNK